MAFRLDRKMKITKVHRLGGHQYPHPRRNRDHVAGPQGTQHRRHRHGINSGRRRNNLRLLLPAHVRRPVPSGKHLHPPHRLGLGLGKSTRACVQAARLAGPTFADQASAAVGGIEWPLTVGWPMCLETDSRRAPRRNTAIAVFECGNTLARFVMCG
jgi:hypothetical protein